MNKVAFIVPYFGKFNDYFQLFLNSCEENRDLCDWIIFTDNKRDYSYPENVFVHYTTFEKMCRMIQQKFDFEIQLKAPYKLCDYRPAYGYIFNEFLDGYTFWGHCDLDLLWGKMSDFLTDEMMDTYPKIFNLGHCTLYRNTEEINTLFMKKLNGRERYQEVFENISNCSFDEEYRASINNIFLDNGYKIFERSFAANTYTKTSNFRLTYLCEDRRSYSVEPMKKNFFVWDHGKLHRYVVQKDEIKKQDYMYIHFQSRPMKNKLAHTKEKIFKIIPNAFEYLEIPEKYINKNTVRKIKFKNPNLHYFRLRSKNLMVKLRREAGRNV